MATQKRIDQFVVDRSAFALGSPLFPDILQSARHLLSLATIEHRTRDSTLHDFTVHGPAAIMLAVSAFDLWLATVAFALRKDDKDMRALLSLNVPKRYLQLYRRAQPGKADPDIGDLKIAVEVRNEITHHFQRPSPRHLPAWVPTLEARGLMSVFRRVPEADWHLTGKLSSYALTYWIFETVEAMVIALLTNGIRGRLEMENYAIREFGAYRAVGTK